MASSLIHICVANEINKKLKRDKSSILIGTISPDIAKLIGEKKLKSHFLDSNDTDLPNFDKFLSKYKNYLNDDFVLGYYIHLYTDYLWFKYFIPEIVDRTTITTLDGKKINCSKDLITKYIYNDYTNLNRKLIDTYNLDLKIFYNELPQFKNIIEEIPMDKLHLIVNKAGLIIEESKETKAYSFDIDNIKKFIETSTNLIIANIEELGVK